MPRMILFGISMLNYEDDYTIYSHGEISVSYVRILVIMPIDHYAKSLSDGFAGFIDSTAGSPSCRFSAFNSFVFGIPINGYIYEQ